MPRDDSGTRRFFARIEIKSFLEGDRTFEGIATTGNADRMEDIVVPEGGVFNLPVPFLSQHSPLKAIGQITSIKVVGNQMRVKGFVAKFDEPPTLKERVDVAWAEFKSGLVRGLSIGFNPLEWSEIKGTFGLKFTSWELLEISGVTIPANVEATITTVKSYYQKSYSRAALGTGGNDQTAPPTSPGASGSQSKGTRTMPAKSFKAKITELSEERTKSANRMSELMEQCDGQIETLDAELQKEYDTLINTVGTYDRDLRRLKAHEAATTGIVEIGDDVGTDAAKASNARRGIPATKDEKREKGIGFAQYAKLLGRTKGNVMHALAMAQNMRGIDQRVVAVLKTAVEAGSVSGSSASGNWGMELVGVEGGIFADFAEFLRPTTIIGKFGTGGVPSLRRVPFRVALVGQTAGGTGYWVGEGKAKPLTKFQFARNRLEPLKTAAITALSEELIMDSSPSADAMIRDQLAACLREREDTDFINPAFAGSAGVSPAAITYGITPTGSSGTSAANVRTDLKALFQTFIDDNNTPSSAVWVMQSSLALSLSLMMNSLGQPEFPGVTMNGGTLAGLPVITSEYVPTGYVALVNAQDIYFADDGDVRVDTSGHASLEMDDAPAHNSTTPTPASLVSMFQTNSIAYRAEHRIDWMRRRDSGVALLSGAAWA